jgi:hypothetical protein
MRMIFLFVFTLVLLQSSAQGRFDNYFHDKTLRIDFMLAGNYSKTVVYPAGMKEEPHWAGSFSKLIDPFDYGNFKYELRDAETNELIYSRGFCSLYQEWQTTAEAKLIERSFYEVATMPFPKKMAKFILSIRQRNGSFSEIYTSSVDPTDYFIGKEKPLNAKATKVFDAGDPHRCVDLAFIAEGYSANEMDKFVSDVKMLSASLFEEPPFNKYKDKINIWAVEAVSEESGTDIPGEGIYVKTALNSGFYTFNIDRYLTTRDIKSVNDYAAAAPHDHIIVLINSPRYGGGGVYNYYSGTSADHPMASMVFAHELGHGLAGLADEYYSSEVAYEEYYPFDVEPWEPNITTMVNFEAKWKKLVGKGIPVPTPPEEKYQNVTGVFEGGGYSAKGIFRPEFDCRMKSNSSKGFCKVCSEALQEVMDFYTK